MIEMKARKGDITKAESGLILHQVNCQGVMGAGVARAIRNKWPEVYTEYTEFCDTHYGSHGDGLLGSFSITPVKHNIWVGNLFGQKFFGRGQRYTSYDALDSSLKLAADWCNSHCVTDIHFPQIGCGLGGGEWWIVENLIQGNLKDFNLTYWTL